MHASTYIPLRPSSNDFSSSRNYARTHHVLLACSFLLNIIFGLVWMSGRVKALHDPITLYSPAQEALEYRTIKFHSGFGSGIPMYDQEPSTEVDAAWESLYEYAYNKIPREQAVLLPNKTYPVLGEEGHYMIALDVFHQLHCLDTVRKAMYPEHYPATPEGVDTPHMRHCISSLRQSLMCSADISPIVWQWSNRSQAAKERSDVVHTCRNFDKIKEWAREHLLDRQQDMSVYIEDDLRALTY